MCPSPLPARPEPCRGGAGRLPVRVAPVLALGFALLAGGCRSGPAVAEVQRILVPPAEVAAHPALGRNADELRRELELALAKSGRFRIVPGLDAREPLTVALHLAGAGVLRDPGGAGEPRAAVVLELELTGPNRLSARGQGEEPFPVGDAAARSRAFGTALERALAEAVLGLASLGDAGSASDETLVADLDAPDPGRREVALRLLVERKSRAAVEPLIRRLADPDPEEVLRAATALAAIGDGRAAPALIEAASRREPSFVARLAIALGDLGGPEAEAYLFTASAGHPDPGVRAAAGEALATLRANRSRRAAADRPAAP